MNENLIFTNDECKLIEKCIDEKLAQLSTWIGNNQFAEKEYIELSVLKAKFTAVLYIETIKLKTKNNQHNVTKVTNVTDCAEKSPYKLPTSVVDDHNDSIECIGNPEIALYGEISTSNKVEIDGETKTITESIRIK